MCSSDLDAYKGVIVFCRVLDGRVKKGTQIRMMATGFTTEVVEVGYFGAGQFIPCDELTAGMVGYITASIKNLGDTRVGDTVTDNERPCAEALPGYKKVQPMVYCGLYPADGAKYGDLTMKNHQLPCFANPQDFQEAATHLVKFGATNDYAYQDSDG